MLRLNCKTPVLMSFDFVMLQALGLQLCYKRIQSQVLSEFAIAVFLWVPMEDRFCPYYFQTLGLQLY